MALEYGYFDSEITGYDDEGMPEFDRAQTSDFMASFFSKLITSGVCADPADSFQVTAYSGMQVAVQPGYAFVAGRFAFDEETAYVTLEDASSSYGRIDMVVLRNNYNDRLCEIVVKTGTAAKTPVEPTLTRDDGYYELCLAKISVGAGVSSITKSAITDTRYDSAYCGIVTQLIDSVDVSAIVAGMQESFETWFEAIQAQLTDDAAGNLQSQIDQMKESLETGDLKVTGTATLGTDTIGSTSKPVYLKNGLITALSSTVGGTAKPVYLNAGALAALSSTVGGTAKPVYMKSGTLTALSSSVGGTAKPVYLNAGALTALSDTVGGTTKPVYLNAGTVTALSGTIGSSNRPMYLNSGTMSACGFRLVAGSKVVTASSSNTSVAVLTNSQLNSLFGVSNCSNVNTTCVFANGDGAAQTIHIEGATYKSSTWYACFPGYPAAGSFRVNYIAVYFG